MCFSVGASSMRPGRSPCSHRSISTAPLAGPQMWQISGSRVIRQMTKLRLHRIYVLRRRWSSVRVADDSPGTDRYLSDVSNPSWKALEPQGRCRSGSSTAPSFRLSFSRCCSRRLKWPRAVAANLASLSIRAVAVSPGMVFGLHGELSAQSILDGHSST